MSVFKSVSKSVFSSVHRSTSVPAALAGSAAFSLPSSLTEYWLAGQGMFQDSGMTQPVTAAGQTVAKWVGRRLGTVLTGTSCVAKLVNGVLIPTFSLNSGDLQLPTSYATNKRDQTVLMCVQRPSAWGDRGFYGFSTSARSFELMNYQRIDLLTYDGTTVQYCAKAPKCSPCVVSSRASSSNIKIGVNGSEVTKTVQTAGSLTGGRFNSLHDATVSGSGRWLGIALGPLINDTDFNTAVSAFSTQFSIPSETAPTVNLAAYGDSNTEGTNSNGVSWQYMFADTDRYRVLGVAASAQYFGVGGAPLNAAASTTQLDLEKIAGAGKNVIVVAFTNDFDQGVGAGAAHFARVKTWGQARQAAGWKVAVCKMPNRAAPFVGVTQYNTEVASFNSSCDSDPWMDYKPDLTVINGTGLQSDGIHWTEAAQSTIYSAIKTGIA